MRGGSGMHCGTPDVPATPKVPLGARSARRHISAGRLAGELWNEKGGPKAGDIAISKPATFGTG
jgi:hypothetical protein